MPHRARNVLRAWPRGHHRLWISRTVSAPEAQTVNLMLSLQVGHANFEYRRAPVLAHHGSHIGATYLFPIKRGFESQRPYTLQLSQRVGQAIKPRSSLRRLLAVVQQSVRNLKSHTDRSISLVIRPRVGLMMVIDEAFSLFRLWLGLLLFPELSPPQLLGLCHSSASSNGYRSFRRVPVR